MDIHVSHLPRYSPALCLGLSLACLTTLPLSSYASPPLSTWGDIGRAGGRLELAGTVNVKFAEGTFMHTQTVRLDVIDDAKENALFTMTTVNYGIGSGLPFQVRINTGKEKPSKPVLVDITLPESFASPLPDDSWIRLFGYSLLDEDGIRMEMYEHCGNRFRPAQETVSVPLIPSFFSMLRTANGSYEAVVTLGASVPD